MGTSGSGRCVRTVSRPSASVFSSAFCHTSRGPGEGRRAHGDQS
jgi:hypothetical protein